VPDGVMAMPLERTSAANSSVRYRGLPGGQPQQPDVRPTTREGADQFGYRRLGERVQVNTVILVHRPTQRQEVFALWGRASHADEKE
jgi:hypothetical protein